MAAVAGVFRHTSVHVRGDTMAAERHPKPVYTWIFFHRTGSRGALFRDCGGDGAGGEAFGPLGRAAVAYGAAGAGRGSGTGSGGLWLDARPSDGGSFRGGLLAVGAVLAVSAGMVLVVGSERASVD